jgi:hypothetical protein
VRTKSEPAHLPIESICRPEEYSLTATLAISVYSVKVDPEEEVKEEATEEAKEEAGGEVGADARADTVKQVAEDVRRVVRAVVREGGLGEAELYPPV